MEQIGSRTKPQSSNSASLPQGNLTPAVPLQPSIIPPKPSAVQNLLRGMLLLAAVTASATVGLAAALMVPLPTQVMSSDKGPRSLGDLFQYQVGRPVNILVMGIDRVPEAKEGSPQMFEGRSDTMLLLRVDPTNDSVSLLSIPRDTQVEIPGIGVTKINDANVRGGPKLSARTVSGLLNGVEIDRYVRVSTDAFRELVDLLGGVEVYVPKRMEYVDNTQKLKIDLQPGLQTLNGSQAEQFARFRHDDYGDVGRVQRQQTLLKSLRKRITSPMVIPRIPALIGAMQKYIDTNLSPEEMLALVGAGRRLAQGEVKMVMLPGRFSAPGEFNASYWIMDPGGRDRVMQQYFKVDPTETAGEARSASSLRIAIQNASSQPNAAEQMRSHLLDLGFSSVYIAEDWPDKHRQTEIVVQQGDMSSAQDLQNLLGFGRIEADSTGDLESDLTIRVGEDWVKQKSSKP